MCTQLLPSSFRQTLMKIIDMDKNFPFSFALCSFFLFHKNWKIRSDEKLFLKGVFLSCFVIVSGEHPHTDSPGLINLGTLSIAINYWRKVSKCCLIGENWLQSSGRCRELQVETRAVLFSEALISIYHENGYLWSQLIWLLCEAPGH